MHHKIKLLVKYLKYFHNLMDGQAPHPSQVAVAESIPLALEYFENEIDTIIPEIESCRLRDYEKVAELFFKINFELSQYILDIERFSFVWFEMWRHYYKQNKFISLERPSFGPISDKNHMQVILTKILKLLLKFNCLPRKKIIHKSDFQSVKTQVENFSTVSKKISVFINSLAFADVNNIDNTMHSLGIIDCKIRDYRCELEYVRDAVKKVAEAYREKDEWIKRYK